MSSFRCSGYSHPGSGVYDCGSRSDLKSNVKFSFRVIYEYCQIGIVKVYCFNLDFCFVVKIKSTKHDKNGCGHLKNCIFYKTRCKIKFFGKYAGISSAP